MELQIRPVTADLWSALEDLFGDSSTCSRCWCMYWRIGPAYRKRPGTANRAALKAVVEKGPPPGVLAFAGDLPVGWCQITPRGALPHLDRDRRLRRVDALPVWSISCFYVRKGYRRRGVTAALIAAALAVAKRAGAPAVEAYPLDGALSTSVSFTGHASTFARAGFRVVARNAPTRPTLRFDLAAADRPAKSASIDEYLDRLPEAQRLALTRLREIIRRAAPDASEYIAYGLPAFRLHGRPLVAFGAAARHCAFYPMSAKTIDDHREELARFSTSRGTIRFRPEAPLPAALVRKLVKSRIQENETKRPNSRAGGRPQPRKEEPTPK